MSAPPWPRSLSGSFVNAMMIAASLAANFLTYLVGDHDSTLSVDGAFYAVIAANVIDIPLGLVGVGEHAARATAPSRAAASPMMLRFVIH